VQRNVNVYVWRVFVRHDRFNGAVNIANRVIRNWSGSGTINGGNNKHAVNARGPAVQKRDVIPNGVAVEG
jgi:hypothetical protein